MGRTAAGQEEAKAEGFNVNKDIETYAQACSNFVGWIDANVMTAARGDGIDALEVSPASTFWLGRLASEEEVSQSVIGDRAERLDPCAIAIRLKPSAEEGPWDIRARMEFRAWLKDGPDATPWIKSEPIQVHVQLTVGRDGASGGASESAALLAAAGAAGLSAEVRVDVEHRKDGPELVIQLVNISPARVSNLSDTHLFETRLSVGGVLTTPFVMESLPDSFRFDRSIDAYGVNVGVERLEGNPLELRTVDNVAVDTKRPLYWNSSAAEPDLSFASLAKDPLPSLTKLVVALGDWNSLHWSDDALDRSSVDRGWSVGMRDEASVEAVKAADEYARLKNGLDILGSNPDLARAFRLMNRAIAHSSRGNYAAWRPFQIGFLLSALGYLDDPDGGDRDVVDTVWFATGGGKTETYLGLLVTTAFYDRLTGKSTGVTAWSRFPLRLLSLQQTQRFADALAGAELVRRAEAIGGDPFSLGFLVGKGGTPNRIVNDSNGDHPDPDSPGMPDQYQVLLNCPFCFSDSVEMRFDRRFWRLDHRCNNNVCPWPERALPFSIVDHDIYRTLPTVVLGTLDKAASVGMQQAMRGLVGPPVSMCSIEGHGYAYSPRKANPAGCLVPDCQGSSIDLPMPEARYAPTLRLQDELHLLRDSLGAVDSHYESLLDHLQSELGGKKAKVVASSATLSGHDRQVEVLYRRAGRVFPQQGPTAGDSFWTRRSNEELRRFVAVAPRGVTLEHVSDRTVSVLQESIRRLKEEPQTVCAEAKVDFAFADELVSDYGTNVVYGTSLYDVEAAERSLASNTNVGAINSVQMTGQTEFDDVRDILKRLEEPETAFEERIHVVAASSMLSHGVDVSRLNTMVMLGLPLSAAEFIQTSARVGRAKPGLVYVLHKIGRERDAETFRHFREFVTQGDRFVDPIPITRRSRRVLRLTLPGIVEARRLNVWEPRSINKRLTTINTLRDFVAQTQKEPSSELLTIAAALGFDHQSDVLLRNEISEWLETWFRNLDDLSSGLTWPSELSPNPPMRSLRDVETSAPIFEKRT